MLEKEDGIIWNANHVKPTSNFTPLSQFSADLSLTKICGRLIYLFALLWSWCDRRWHVKKWKY